MLTRGQKAFRDAVNRLGGQVKTARILGVSHQAVSNWMNGIRVPDGDNREVIEIRLEIPMKWWREPLENPLRRVA